MSSSSSNTSDSSDLEDEDFEMFLESQTPSKSQRNKKSDRFFDENSLERQVRVKRNNDEKQQTASMGQYHTLVRRCDENGYLIV